MPTPTDPRHAIVRDLIARVAPGEVWMVDDAFREYIADPESFDEDPAKLVAHGGGKMIGFGAETVVAFVLPFVLPVVREVVEAIGRKLAEDAADHVVRAAKRRRWWPFARRTQPAPNPAPVLIVLGPLTAADQAVVKRITGERGARYGVPAERVAEIEAALVEVFIGRYGRAEPDDG